MSDLKAEIGERVRVARKAKGLTLAGLSRQARISTSFLSDVETGKRNIAAARLLRISEVCEVPVSALLDGLNTARVVRLGVIEFHSPRVNPGLIERFYAVVDDLKASGSIVDVWLMDIATVLGEFGYQMTITSDKPKPVATLRSPEIP